MGDLLELGLGRLVVRVLLERPAVGVECGRRVADSLGQDGADLQEQLDARADGVRGRDLDLEALDDLRPGLQPLVDRQQDGRHGELEALVAEPTLEATTRLLVGGVDLEHLTVQLDRVGGDAELVLGEDAEAQQQPAAGVVGGGRRELAPEDVGQLVPLALGQVHAVERREGAEVLDAGGQHGLVGGDRLLDVPGLLEDAADVGLDGAALVVFVGERELGAEDVEQVLLAAEREVEALERGEGRRLLAVDLEDRLVGRERGVEVADPLLVDLRQLEALRDALGIGAVLLDATLERLDELGPRADLLTETEHVVANVGLGVVLGEGLAVVAEGQRVVAGDALAEIGEAAQQLIALLGVLAVVELDLERHVDVPLVVGLLVQRDQGVGNGEVVVVEAERLLEGLDGLVGLVEAGVIQVGDLQQQRGALAALGGLGLLLEHADELAPLVLLGVELLQALHVADDQVELLERVLSAPVLGLEAVELLPGGDGGLVVVELVAEQRAELDEVLDPLGVVLLDLGERGEDLGELGPLLLALEQTLELLEGLMVAGIGDQDLAPQLDRQRVLLDLGDRGASDVQQLLHALRGVREERELLLLDVDHLLPVAPLGVEVLELGDRLGVELVGLEHALEALDGLGLVVELVEEEAAGLEVQGGASGRVLGELGAATDATDEVGPALHRVELGLLGLDDLEQGLGVVGVLEHLLERGEGGDHETGLTQVVAVDLDELPVRGLGVLGVAGRVLLELVLQQVGDVGPLAGLGIQLAQANPRITLAGELLDRIAPTVDRLGSTSALGVAGGVEEALLLGAVHLAADLDRVAGERCGLGCGLLRGCTLGCCGLLRLFGGGLLSGSLFSVGFFSGSLFSGGLVGSGLFSGGLFGSGLFGSGLFGSSHRGGRLVHVRGRAPARLERLERDRRGALGLRHRRRDARHLELPPVLEILEVFLFIRLAHGAVLVADDRARKAELGRAARSAPWLAVAPHFP